MDENQNIENFFRKRLEQQNFSFQESDWQRLEQKLNAAGLSVSTVNTSVLSATKTAIIISVAVASAFILGWFAHDTFLKGKTNEIREQKADKKIVITPSSDLTNKNTKYIDETNKSVKSEKGIKTSIEKTNNTYKNTSNALPISEENSVVSNKEYKTENENKSVKHYQSKNIEIIDSGNIETVQRTAFLQKNYQALAPLPINVSEINSNLPIEITNPDIQIYIIKDTEKHAKNAPSFWYRWAIGISVASDFNSIGVLNEKSITPKFGARVYFDISPKWSVLTGIQYNNKKYNTTAENYAPGNQYWQRKTNGVLPDKIIGSCKVIDIPIMISYRVMHKGFVSFKTSAGISNYLLLDEIYAFEFTQDNPGSATGWETTENTMAPLTIGNISFGIDIQTGKRIFLTFEPFIQVPLKDIGWGNVQLYSTGIQAIIKYRL